MGPGALWRRGRARYPLLQPDPTWHEQKVEDWWGGACQALRACTAKVDAHSLQAIGITHEHESFAPVDRKGHALRNAILWSDASAQPGALCRTRRPLGPRGAAPAHRQAASMTQSLPKILWLLMHEPETLTAPTESSMSTPFWCTG